MLQRLAGDASLPPLNTPDLGHDRDHGGMSVSQLLEPFVPPGVRQGSAAVPATEPQSRRTLWARLATFNTLSLGVATEQGPEISAEATGLAYQPGRAQMLAAQLAAHGVHIACLQETRCEQGSLRTGGYLRYCSGAQRGQWGTEWWFRDEWDLSWPSGCASFRLRASIFTTIHADPRRLFVRMACDKFRVVFVGLHAPHRATEHSALTAWWDDTHRLIRAHARNDQVVLAGDMNASLGSVSSPFVSDHGAEAEDVPGEALHAILNEFEVLLPATHAHLHSGPHHTYVQKRGQRLCRPDFIGVPPGWAGSESASFLVPDINAGHSCPDHIAAVFDAVFSCAPASPSDPSKGRRFRLCSLSDAGMDKVEQAIRGFPAPSWDISAHAHAAALTNCVQVALEAAVSKKPARPYRPYLQPESWTLQQQVAAVRRSLHRLQHHLQHHSRLHILAKTFRGWCKRDVLDLAGLAEDGWLKRAHHSTAALLSHLRALGSRLKKACRRDRDEYVSQLADQLACCPTSEIFHRLHSLLGHRRRKKLQVDPLPAVANLDGTMCQDGAETMTRWRNHFGSMEGGQTATMSELIAHWDASIQHSRDDHPWPSPPTSAMLPTETDLQRLLACAKPGKSPGMDGIPAEIGRKFAGLLAPHLHRLALKTAMRGVEPCGFKAGEIIWFYKGKGPHSSCSSYRAILLLPVWSKVIHQSLRPPMKAHFESRSPSLQLGGKTGCSVVFGCHLVRGVSRVATAAGKSHFTLFADIASAYYCVVQHLVAKWDGRSQQSALAAAATPDEEAALEDALAEHLLQPTALRAGGASTWLEALTDRLQADNFFLLRGDDKAVMTTKGSRPGSSWADLIFAALMRRILERRNQMRGKCQPLSISMVLPFDGQKTLEPCSADSPGLDVSEVIWADDLAIPRIVEPEHAATAAGFEAGILADAFLEFGFTLTFGPHKTAGLLTLRGRGSRHIRRDVFGAHGLQGRIPVLRETQPGVVLPLVDIYRHLGCQQSPAGSLKAEILYRVSQARATFAEARRKVYKNPHISTRRKGFILGATVIPKLVYGAGAWGPLSTSEFRVFSGAVWGFYRPMLGIKRTDDQRVDASTCFALLGMPSPAVLLQVQRLLYLGQMLRTGPPELWAVLRADRGQASQFQADLRWLHARTWSTTDLPCPMTGWPHWEQFIVHQPGRYKGAIKRAKAIEVCRHTVVASLTGLHRALVQICGMDHASKPSCGDATLTEVCIPCKRAFSSRLAWAGHAARKHGYRSHAFLCAQGRVCLGCGRQYSSSGRLRRHLETRPGCVTSWGRFIPDDTSPVGGDAHPQAPPVQAPGCLDPTAEHHIRTDISLGLFDDLNSHDPEDEQGIWDLISSYVEPIGVLRDTVRAWVRSANSCAARRNTADNMLLLLDVELLAEHVQPANPAKAFPQEALPEWGKPGLAPFVLSGPARVFSLESPPRTLLDHALPDSMRLKDAVAFSTWMESCCSVMAHLLEASKASPVCLQCPGIDRALGPAKGWLVHAGFQVSASGVRSPRD